MSSSSIITSDLPFQKLISIFMASKTQTYLITIFLFSLHILHSSQIPNVSPIKTLVLPVTKNPSTHQYITTISQRTPLVPINLVINLNGPFLWVSCDNSSYISSSYRLANCRSPLCTLTHKFFKSRPQCTNNTCLVPAENVVTSKISSGNLSIDVLSLYATNGLNPTTLVSVPRFAFSCSRNSLLQGLASGAQGIAGLGHSEISLPMQLANRLNFTQKFAICVPPLGSNGVIFMGEEPYVLLPGIDVSKILTYTPLLTTRSTYTGMNLNSLEYYIKVKSIRVNGKNIPLNSFSSRGTKIVSKISTINPYTMLESSIYSSLTSIFIQEAIEANATRVQEIEPFRVCFSTNTNGTGGFVRPAFPFVDLVLQDEKVFWRIFETNLMVPIGNDSTCLGFLDGGVNMSSGIIIGGYQLEDNFLQFDVMNSRLGFTSLLLMRETSCGGFNFTSI